MAKKATPVEAAIARDEIAETHEGPVSILTGERLREKGLCPLVIVRGYESGVSVGYLASCKPDGGRFTVELLEMRRVWSWAGGAQTVSEVAEQGIPMSAGRISKPTRYAAFADIGEIEYVSEAARESLLASRWL